MNTDNVNKNISDCNAHTIPDSEKHNPDEIIKEVIKTYKSYRPDEDTSDIEKAYAMAKEAHEGQLRHSGEPYIVHPVCVAQILADLEMDQESIIAGLLHDVAEDTSFSLEKISEEFGETVAKLVDGVTKLTGINWQGGREEMQAENLRKMFLAMAQDIRVIIIKLADRAHNMRTLQYMKPEKQKEKARETLDIYAPLAERLGISKLKVELDNLALKYLEPEAYAKLVADIERKKSSRDEYISMIVEEVKGHMRDAEISCEVYGRVKHHFSIYKKMLMQSKTLDEIYDLFAIRIIVDSVRDCYAALGIIHEMYTPIPGRFKDYIAMPKPNNYQSLHTTLIGKDGTPFEIQIRTEEMHKTAEYGIAAHWKYKKQGSNEALTKEEERMSWLRRILEWQNDLDDDTEYLSSIKSDLSLFTDNVYCFTPNGDIKVLPKGSTPVDFAYLVHSAVGNRMIGARVNDKLVNIDYRLHSGDRVEIITSQNSRGPSRDWLKIAASAQARNKINQWFRSQSKEVNLENGKDAIDRYCKSKGIDFSKLSKQEYIDKVVRKYGFQDWDSVLVAIGHGGLKEGQVVGKLVELRDSNEKKVVTDDEVMAAISEARRPMRTHTSNAISVKGIDDVSVHMAKCCGPIPGDEIIGFITRGRGISIHRTDCVNIINLPEMERSRLMEADWSDQKTSEKFTAHISIYANDRVGLLADVSRVLTEESIEILSLRTQINKQGVATLIIDFSTAGIDEINKLIAKLRQVESVIDIERTTG